MDTAPSDKPRMELLGASAGTLEAWLCFDSDQRLPLKVGIDLSGERAAVYAIDALTEDERLSGRHRAFIPLDTQEAIDTNQISWRIIDDGLKDDDGDQPADVDLPLGDSGETARHASIPPGYFQVSSACVVEGRVAVGADGAAPTIEVLRDRDVIWSGVPRRPRSHSEVGFRVDLPAPQDWASAFKVSIRLRDSHAPLGPVAVVNPMDRFRGNIDRATLDGNVARIRGWVYDLARPMDSLAISLRSGTTRSQAIAGIERQDLVDEKIGTGRHGFDISLTMPNPDVPDVQLWLDRYEVSLFGSIAVEQVGRPSRKAATFAPRSSRGFIAEYQYEGSIDNINYKLVAGWMRCKEVPGERFAVDLYIDGEYYLTTDTGRLRSDVGKKFGDDGLHGYAFELPPYLACNGDVHLRARARQFGVSHVKDKMLGATPRGLRLNAIPAAAVTSVSANLDTLRGAKIAYIVLNLDGSDLLAEFFESFHRHNRYESYEIIVVDHGSRDGSAAVCDDWASRLSVREISRDGNFSFSESNNYAAALTDAEILVFVNNDIVFTQDVGHELGRILSDDSVGAVGIKLLDRPRHSVLGPNTIQHLGVHFDWFARSKLVQPFETRYGPHLSHVTHAPFEVPAVTGALMACRKTDFDAIGGFDEGFFYGYEDVDLGLRIGFELGKRIVCANQLAAFHVRGISREKSGPSLGERLAANAMRIDEKLGLRLRRAQNRDRFEKPAFWTSVAPRIAFAVTEAKLDAKAGDYFTALEVARELVDALACQIVFLDREHWYDLSGIDVLVTMVDGYDLGSITNAPPHLLTIGWARNWIDRWASKAWAQDYAAFWASSRLAADYLSTALARRVDVVRIATNAETFAAGSIRPEFVCDYCFTGSYFMAPRDIVYALDPSALPFTFAVFGHGWDDVPKFAPFSRGPLPYEDMPDVYASTKIVIDDANSATKQWGSVNSRVFDALAAGALVITNGHSGSDEIFGGLLPSYATAQELDELLWTYLTDEPARLDKVERLQAIVMERETYRHRAKQIVESLKRIARTQLGFSIKIGAPTAAQRNEWGDYHFALGLARALTRHGHRVRIDCLDRWEGPHSLGDDVVIVLRGLSTYKPKPHQINLLWLISHPDMVSRGELEAFDHVFVASASFAEELASSCDATISTLLQCTDPEVFSGAAGPIERNRLLFVGNSRNVFRPIVRDCLAAGLEPDVYGTRWERFLPAKMIKGTYIPNGELARHYRGAVCVLNDHWDDMRRRGFISNRVFDAVACGARVVSDDLPGLKDLFGEAVVTYSSPEHLRSIVSDLESRGADDHQEVSTVARTIRDRHSFDARAAVLLDTTKQLFAGKGVSI